MEIDLREPLPTLDVDGIDALHVTAFWGAVPVGRVIVPTPGDRCTPMTLRPLLGRFDRKCFVTDLRRAEPTPDVLPTATVVVCTAYRPDRVRPCLEAILAQTYPVDEVILVQNDKEENATRQIAEALGVRYIREPDLGLDRARNHGIAEASHDLVLFTDDDVRVGSEWSWWLRRGFNDPNVAAVTGLVLPGALATAGQIDFERHASFVRTLEPFVLDGTMVSPATAGRAGSGASMAFRRTFLAAIGGFPEHLDAGLPARSGGDTHALYQALQHGYRVRYEPRAVARHSHRETGEEALRTVEGYGTGVMAHFEAATRADCNPAPAVAALRWARNRAWVLVRLAVRRPSDASARFVRAQVVGISLAPLRIRASRRLTRMSTPVPIGSARPHVPGEAATSSSPAHEPDIDVSVLVTLAEMSSGITSVVGALQHVDSRVSMELVVTTDRDPALIERVVVDACPGVDVVILSDRVPRSAAARNAAVEKASGEVVIFLAADVVDVDPQWILHHLMPHDEHERALVIGPTLPRHASGSGRSLRARNRWVDRAHRLSSGCPVGFDDVVDGNFSIRRHTFLELGGFRTLPSRVEQELGLRAMAVGVTLVPAPGARAYRSLDETLSDPVAQHWRNGIADAEILAECPLSARCLPVALWELRGPLTCRFTDVAVRRPALGRLLARLLDLVATGVDRFGSRWYLSRLLHLSEAAAYYAGIGHQVGDLSAWGRLRESIATAETAEPTPRVDLADLESWVAPSGPGPGQAIVEFEGRELGRASLALGGIPHMGQVFHEALFQRFGAQAWVARQNKRSSR